MKNALIVIVLMAAKIICAQNLVPNPSFESYTSCPNAPSQINYCAKWFTPTNGTPDYYNACAPMTNPYSVPHTWIGNCSAHFGSGMAGIVLIDDMTGAVIYREYLAAKLSSQLTNGTRYYVTYYARLADSARYASNQINVFFGDTISKNGADTIKVTPQIVNPLANFITSKNSWTRLRGSFIANGGEKFLYLGDFRHPFTNDTLFVNGSNNVSDYDYPYYFIDDICVSTDSSYSENWITSIKENEISELHFFPNPVNDVLHISNIKTGETVKIYSLEGEMTELKVVGTNIDLSHLKEGIYFVKYKNSENKVLNYKLIKVFCNCNNFN